MSKITYEEAIYSMNLLESFSTLSIEEFENRFVRENKTVNSVVTKHRTRLESFINQFKPPTFDEVVKAWDDIGYECDFREDSEDEYCWFELSKMDGHLQCVIGIDEINYIKSAIIHTRQDKKETSSYITFEEHHTINLTIRYLQAKG